MADAETEKLNLLREHRASKERFYYHLTILSGGALTVVVTLITSMKDVVDSLGYSSIIWLLVSICFLSASLFLSMFRNLFASMLVKNIAQDKKITKYEKVIEESIEEKWHVKFLSMCGVTFFIIGLLIFTFVAVQTIL